MPDLSNFPPGVTGNEPHLTGAVEFDPHQPFWVGDDPEIDGSCAVFMGDDEDRWFGCFLEREDADELRDELNDRYSLKECWHGQNSDKPCHICGEPPEGGKS